MYIQGKCIGSMVLHEAPTLASTGATVNSRRKINRQQFQADVEEVDLAERKKKKKKKIPIKNLRKFLICSDFKIFGLIF